MIAKVVDRLPAAIYTDAGTWASKLDEDNVTVAPPVGAGELNETVPVLLTPPTTVLGEAETACTTAA